MATLRIKKEARELWPVLLGTLVLMAAPGVFWPHHPEVVSFVSLLAFGLGCAGMSALVFGSELQHRTLGLLLAQPVRRSAVWTEKMAVLATALALTVAGGWVCLQPAQVEQDFQAQRAITLLFVPLCAFCGAPYLTLRTGSGIAGVVFAGLLPSFVGGIAAALAGWWLSPLATEGVVLGALLLYCLFVYWRGYCAFQKLEWREGGGRELALPPGIERALAGRLGALVPGVTGPILALLKKELRLQQISFLASGLFCVLALVSGVVRWVRHDLGEGLLVATYAVTLILMPFLVGALAVAEERMLGVAEWQLTLPVRARSQWWLKLAVALPTSAVLGLLVPTLLVLLSENLFQWPESKMSLPDLQFILELLLVHGLATTIAIYAASASGSTLRSILLAFGLVLAGSTVFTLTGNLLERWEALWGYQGPRRQEGVLAWAVWVISALFLFGLLQWLALGNFRRCGVSRRGFVLQLVSILLAVAALAGAISLVLWVRS